MKSRFWNRGRPYCFTTTSYTKIPWNNDKGHYAVQGHSRSPILVPIESSCTTSY